MMDIEKKPEREAMNVNYIVSGRETSRSFVSQETLSLVLRMVKDGDKERLASLRAEQMKEIPDGQASESELRRARYGAVAIVAAVTAVLDGETVIHDHALLIVDMLIMQLDLSNTLKEIAACAFDSLNALAILTLQSDASAAVSANVMKAQNYISRNLHAKLSLSEIAANCGLSGSYLSALFKKETGLAVSEYIIQERLREAEYMLIAGTHRISEICYLLSFCSQSYFTQQFKRRYGVTPAQYQKRKPLLYNILHQQIV